MDSKNVPKRKKARYAVIGLIVVLIALFALLRFNPARAGNAPGEVAGKVTLVNVAKTAEASGSLEAQPFANLTWETNGVVEEVYVKAGDVLMKLKTSSVSSNIISAQADLVTAQKDLEDLLVTSNADLAQAVIDLRDAR